MIVKDIMTKQVDFLTSDMSAKQALCKILEKKISGLPVVDENHNLVGMFTEKEVLGFCLPSYIDKVGAFVYERNPKAVLDKLFKLKDLKVSDIMRREVEVVKEETTLSEVSRIILIHHQRRLPVVKDKKLVGIVARVDIVKYLAKECGIEK